MLTERLTRNKRLRNISANAVFILPFVCVRLFLYNAHVHVYNKSN